MPKFRLPSRSHRRASWIAAGVAVAIVALPGVGQAAPSLPPFPTLPVTPGQVSAALPGPQSAACSRIVADDLTALFTDLATPPTQLPTSLSDVLAALTTALGRPPTAAELVAALQGLSPGSLGGVTIPGAGTLAGANTGTQSVTGDSSASNNASTGDTGGSASPAVTTTGNPADVPGDLQQLASDFLTFCIPAPPTLPSTPTTTPTTTSSGSQQQQDTAAATQQETPQTTQPAAQPVSYPGYAATGSIASTALRPASDQRPSETVPLSVLGGVLLVSAAAAVGVRSRARRNGR